MPQNSVGELCNKTKKNRIDFTKDFFPGSPRELETSAKDIVVNFQMKYILIITRRYGQLRGLLLAPAELFYAVLAHFWQFLVFSSNRGNI